MTESGRWLSVSIVTYHPCLELLASVLDHLQASQQAARFSHRLAGAEVVVDNTAPIGGARRAALEALLQRLRSADDDAVSWRLLQTVDNLGYGRANNMALAQCDADFFLVLNPDILMQEDALEQALSFLELWLKVVFR